MKYLIIFESQERKYDALVIAIFTTILTIQLGHCIEQYVLASFKF